MSDMQHLVVKCKTCGWDVLSVLEGMDGGAVWPSASLIHQASLIYTIYTGHMQQHILDALQDIRADAARLL